MKELLKNLDKDERKLIYLRYFSEKTQTQVGKELGISQVQVSRMEKKILKTRPEYRDYIKETGMLVPFPKQLFTKKPIEQEK